MVVIVNAVKECLLLLPVSSKISLSCPFSPSLLLRLYFYKHLRKELILGRLKIGSARAARLTALIAQVDMGDYHQMFQYRHKVPCSSAEMDNYDSRIKREHHKLIGTPVEVAVEKFLSEAASLEHYGVEMYPAINGKGAKVVFGVGPEYIFIYSQQLDVLHR